ncbi:hypothetical protein B0H17DRAFT_1185808 [Mycena rosella]|uniref:Uncharacterized protein n=1 Tax=Mycena rosella TaxID=1033263 RepID=A0AAD7G3Y4_MYCRO|nr:hypothetical protein B0H17DRAFT_1185808 [Mycena rosella]
MSVVYRTVKGAHLKDLPEQLVGAARDGAVLAAPPDTAQVAACACISCLDEICHALRCFEVFWILTCREMVSGSSGVDGDQDVAKPTLEVNLKPSKSSGSRRTRGRKLHVIDDASQGPANASERESRCESQEDDVVVGGKEDGINYREQKPLAVLGAKDPAAFAWPIIVDWEHKEPSVGRVAYTRILEAVAERCHKGHVSILQDPVVIRQASPSFPIGTRHFSRLQYTEQIANHNQPRQVLDVQVHDCRDIGGIECAGTLGLWNVAREDMEEEAKSNAGEESSNGTGPSVMAYFTVMGSRDQTELKRTSSFLNGGWRSREGLSMFPRPKSSKRRNNSPNLVRWAAQIWFTRRAAGDIIVENVSARGFQSRMRGTTVSRHKGDPAKLFRHLQQVNFGADLATRILRVNGRLRDPFRAEPVPSP